MNPNPTKAATTFDLDEAQRLQLAQAHRIVRDQRRLKEAKRIMRDFFLGLGEHPPPKPTEVP